MAMKKRKLPAPSGICRCESCGQWFRSVSAFDFHRTGSYTTTLWEPARRRCLTPGEMAKRDMRLNEHGVWTTGVEFAKKAA
jgi:hypothetical protein